MATLQTTRHRSASIARTRLELVRREQSPAMPVPLDLTLDENDDTAPMPAAINPRPLPSADLATSQPSSQAAVDPYDLIMRIARHYVGWELVSVQHLPDRDVRVAWLVRAEEIDDPSVIIREGRAIRIIVDGVGDLKVQRPVRRVKKSRLMHWLRGPATRT